MKLFKSYTYALSIALISISSLTSRAETLGSSNPKHFELSCLEGSEAGDLKSFFIEDIQKNLFSLTINLESESNVVGSARLSLLENAMIQAGEMTSEERLTGFTLQGAYGTCIHREGSQFRCDNLLAGDNAVDPYIVAHIKGHHRRSISIDLSATRIGVVVVNLASQQKFFARFIMGGLTYNGKLLETVINGYPRNSLAMTLEIPALACNR